MKKLSVLGVVAFALSCSNGPKLLDDGSLQLLVDEAGGTLTTESGAGLVIPPGALDSDVALSILSSVDVVADGAAALPDFVGGDGLAGVVLKPHGVRFAEPVRVSIPTDLTGTEVALMYLDDDGDSTWKSAGPLTIADGVATFETTHFSTWALAPVTAGACPCWTGEDLAFAFRRAADLQLAPRFIDAGDVVHWGAFADQNNADARVGAADCSLVGLVDQTFSDWWPGVTPNGVGGVGIHYLPVDEAQGAACAALLRAAQNGGPAARLQVASSTVPAGYLVKVEVSVDGVLNASLEVGSGSATVDAGPLYAPGTVWTAAVTSAPAGGTCALSATTGTFASPLPADMSVNVTCEVSAAPTPVCPCWTQAELLDAVDTVPDFGEPTQGSSYGYCFTLGGSWQLAQDALAALVYSAMEPESGEVRWEQAFGVTLRDPEQPGLGPVCATFQPSGSSPLGLARTLPITAADAQACFDGLTAEKDLQSLEPCIDGFDSRDSLR